MGGVARPFALHMDAAAGRCGLRDSLAFDQAAVRQEPAERRAAFDSEKTAS